MQLHLIYKWKRNLIPDNLLALRINEKNFFYFLWIYETSLWDIKNEVQCRLLLGTVYQTYLLEECWLGRTDVKWLYKLMFMRDDKAESNKKMWDMKTKFSSENEI